MLTHLGANSKATIFYLLAFGMALLLAIFGHGMGDFILILSMFTPLAAVLLMMLVVTRDGYSRGGWAILGLNRLGVRQWGWAVGGPLLVLGTTYGIVWATNVGRIDEAGIQGMLTIDWVLNFTVGFAIGLVAAFAEEIGWRGYLLPNLLSIGRVRAMLLTGFLHGVWHLPLMFLTPFYHAEGDRLIVTVLFLLTLTSAGLAYGYLRLMSDSVWPPTLAHAVLNLAWSILAGLTIPVASSLLLEYLAGESGIITLIGVTILGVWLVSRMPTELDSTKTTSVPVGKAIV